ncbi:unnamed protein product, partial [marine sediment metagenome]
RILATYANTPTNENMTTEKRYITAKFAETSLSGKGFGTTVPM